MLYFFLKHLVFYAVLLGLLNWKTGEQSLSFPHSKGLIWTSCMHFWFLTSWCTLLMYSLTNKKIKINYNNEKSGQFTGQALWFLSWDQQRQIFGCTLWTSQGQTGFEGHGALFTPWGSTKCWSLLRWLHSHHLLTPGLDFCPTGIRTRKQRTKKARKVLHPPATPLNSSSLHSIKKPDTHLTNALHIHDQACFTWY